MDLRPVNPYYSRCGSCGEVTYTPQHLVEGKSRADVAESTPVPRLLFGEQTVPLPIRTHPRKRLIIVVLGLTASALFGVSLPLAIVLLAGALGTTIEETLRRTGVSLIVTLWIFHQVAITITGAYASVMVYRKRAEAGAGWITFGIFATVMCSLFVIFGSMVGAAFGIVGGVLLLGAGVFDLV